MKILGFLMLLALVSCATPGVQKRFDEFAGGEVIDLAHNQLDTPGVGDVYFNAKAVKPKEGATKVEIVGILDYEFASIEPLFTIDQTKDLALIVDGKNVNLKPLANTYNHQRLMGAFNPLHIETQHYTVTMEELKMISEAKEVKMKIFCKTHKDGGVAGSFTPQNFDKVKEFISSL